MGEVDQLQDPVDEGVAERDEAVDRAVRRADDADVQEPRRILEELHGEPDEDAGQEEEPDDVDEARALNPPERHGGRRHEARL